MGKYNSMQALRIAGMLLSMSNETSENINSLEIFSKIEGYEKELSRNPEEVIKILGGYINQLPPYSRVFFENKTGIYSGLFSLFSAEESRKYEDLMSLLANAEKEEGLLRKLSDQCN
jgi:hypothetical protein